MSDDPRGLLLSLTQLDNSRQVRGTVLRYGRSLGFTRVDIFHGGESGPLVATGRHTKAFSQQGQRLLATDIGVS